MDISTEIAAVQAASEGSELRQPLVDALNKLNSGALPTVTAQDEGKILKVGTNGWELGDKSGYMPVPSATKQISNNGTYDVTDYSSAVVNVNQGGITLISKTINQNGTYDPADDNADGYNEVVVNVSGGDIWPDEYIESSGTQYIDTGYIASDDSKFELMAEFPSSNQSYACAFGVRDSGGDSPANASCLIFAHYQNQNQGIVANFGSSAIVLPTGYKTYFKKTKYILTKGNISALTEDGVILGTLFTSSASASSTNSIYIFGLDEGGSNYGSVTNCTMKFYRLKIWERNILVHEFVPWKDSNDIVCLKDTVTGDLKYNAGTGVFIYGTDSAA